MFKKNASQQRTKPFKFKLKSRLSLMTNKTFSEPLRFWFAYGLCQKTVASTFFSSSFTTKNKQQHFFCNFKNQLLWNVQLLPFFFAVSLNSYAQVRRGNLVLPSGKLFKTSNLLKAEPFEKKLTKNSKQKSSCKFFKRLKQNVRGVAKNAVDHKHGGKGRGGVLRGF